MVAPNGSGPEASTGKIKELGKTTSLSHAL